MKIYDNGGYLAFWDCLANVMKIHHFASLAPRLEHLSKYVTYVT